MFVDSVMKTVWKAIKELVCYNYFIGAFLSLNRLI